jgi:hypothetical protein
MSARLGVSPVSTWQAMTSRQAAGVVTMNIAAPL